MRPGSIARSAYLILLAGFVAAALAAFATTASAAGPWDGTYECRDFRPSSTIRNDSSAPVGYCHGWVGTITITDGRLRGTLKQVYRPDGTKTYQSRMILAPISGRVTSSGAFSDAILRVAGKAYRFDRTIAGAWALNDQRRGWFFRLTATTQARARTPTDRRTTAAQVGTSCSLGISSVSVFRSARSRSDRLVSFGGCADGFEFEVVAREGGNWYRVRLRDGRRGFIEAKSVVLKALVAERLGTGRRTTAARNPAPAVGSYCYRPDSNTMAELRGPACASDAFKVTASDFQTWRTDKAAFLRSFERPATIAGGGDFAAGKAAYDAGDYVEARAIILPLARRGQPDAQTLLGVMYVLGRGVAQSNTEALRLFRKAADQGFNRAQRNVGGMYAEGRGVIRNDAEAVRWYRLAAEQNDPRAQTNLGIMYDKGRGVAQDYSEAVRWYRKAANQGDAGAQNSLGVMYQNGRGVAQDYAEAVRWYREAADQGDAGAQNNLGVMYDKGRGVAQDYAEAVRWYREAAVQGSAIAQNNLGWMYQNGRGVAQDNAEAVRWYRRAVDQRNPRAQTNLARLEREHPAAAAEAKRREEAATRADAPVRTTAQNEGVGNCHLGNSSVSVYRSARLAGAALSRFGGCADGFEFEVVSSLGDNLYGVRLPGGRSGFIEARSLVIKALVAERFDNMEAAERRRVAEERARAEEARRTEEARRAAAAEAERRRVTEEQKRAVEEAERQRIAGLTRGLASADVVTAIVNDGVNLRALPESTASVVRQLPKGRQVQVTGVLPSGWLRITEEATAVGWIFKTAVAPGTLAATPHAAARPAVVAATPDEVELDPLDAPYRITSAANVRAAPDVSARRVAGLREGDRVTALGKVRGKDWYLVERDGERLGFVFGPLLTPAATSPQTQVAAVAVATRRAEQPQPALAPERRIALVIGNGRYSGQAPPLANPPNDARLMTSVLRARGFEVVELIDADRREMKRAISDFGRRLEAAGENSVGLFYYAGHGVQLDGRNFLIPIGAEISREPDVDIEAVNAAAVLAQMAFARNRLNFMILDSCRNIPYARGFRAVTRGLARMDASRGTLVAYATGPGEVALDGNGLNSPYTLALAEAMAIPGIPVEQMFKRVRESVIEQTNDEQVPWESSSITGDFFFNPVATPAVLVNVPAAERAPSETAEITFWNTIKDGDNRAAFEAYLAQFPTGVFATLARIRLDELAPE